MSWVSKGLSCLDWVCALRALKLFMGLWKVAVGLVETSLPPPKEFETEGERTSSALPPRTGISRAAEGIVVGECRKWEVEGGGLDDEENKEDYFWVSRIKRGSHAYQRVTVPVMTWKSFAPICPLSLRSRANPHQKSEGPDGEGSTLQLLRADMKPAYYILIL